MGTIPKLSANTLMQITGVTGKQYKKVRWHDRDLIVRQFLPVEEYVELVQHILQDSTSPEHEIVPELIDFAIRKNIVSAYAFVELPEDINNVFYMLYASDIFHTVCSVANEEQVESVIRSVMLYAR